MIHAQEVCNPASQLFGDVLRYVDAILTSAGATAPFRSHNLDPQLGNDGAGSGLKSSATISRIFVSNGVSVSTSIVVSLFTI